MCIKKTVARTVAVNYKPSSVFDGHLSSRIVANTVKRYFWRSGEQPLTLLNLASGGVYIATLVT